MVLDCSSVGDVPVAERFFIPRNRFFQDRIVASPPPAFEYSDAVDFKRVLGVSAPRTLGLYVSVTVFLFLIKRVCRRRRILLAQVTMER